MKLAFPELFLNAIGIGGPGEGSPPASDSTGVVGKASSFLFLGVAHFLAFGVRGEPDGFATIFEPLAVLSSVHTTRSYCGDDEAVRARFLRMRTGWGK